MYRKCAVFGVRKTFHTGRRLYLRSVNVAAMNDVICIVFPLLLPPFPQRLLAFHVLWARGAHLGLPPVHSTLVSLLLRHLYRIPTFKL